MKKIGKVVLYLLGGLFILGLAGFLFFSEKKPDGKVGPEADALAQQMLASVNAEAWENTPWIKWSFAGRNHYVWNKSRDLVKVSWQSNDVLLNTKTLEGKAFEAGIALTGDQEADALQKAWKLFCNDSYWLNPMVKAFDPGTQRALVTMEDGSTGLMITHGSGGATPGDSYLYILDDNNRPVAWKMWVGIIPIGGIKNSWEGWITLETGAVVSTKHSLAGKSFEMINHVEGGLDYGSIGLARDPFEDIK
ncbi:MAG: hypothetical protein KTR24_04395 [Saprospiraceae bacterium]|nr:hypothetical protein [Saprospiraceae bacterium]